MKKKFQIILSLSMFLVLLAGSVVHTLISYRHIYSQLVAQVIEDNRVIGGAVLKLLSKQANADLPGTGNADPSATGNTGPSDEALALSLNHMCNEIMLPNKGFLCAVGSDGYLMAAPNFKKGSKVNMADLPMTTFKENKTLTLKEVEQGTVFAGTAQFSGAAAHTDIVVTMPIAASGITLMIHQNRDAVKDRAFQQVKPLFYIGFAVSLLLGVGVFFLVNRLTTRYENRLELLNRELTESNAELTEINSQRKEFLHILSHDLANPLGTIVNASEKICLNRQNSGELEEAGKLIRSSANHSLGIIQLIRRMQELEARKFKLELKPVDLRNVSELAYKILERKFYAKKIQFRNRIPDNMVVQAETVSLCNTVLTNLLSNAVKFSPRGSTVEISAHTDGDRIKVVLSDSGIGMPEHILSELFTITPETIRPGTDGERGTGFGMPLVRRFMEVFGGHIVVDSCESGDNDEEADGCGTVVTLFLQPAKAF